MKKLFLLLILAFSSFISSAQSEDNIGFGVIVFYMTRNVCTCDIAINNIKASQLPSKSKLIYKIFSEGQLTIFSEYECAKQGVSATINVDIKNGDTVYLKVGLDQIQKRNRAEYVQDTSGKNFKSNIFSKENINFPYNPISDKKITKGFERTGSGFLISDKGYIITNYHVIDGAKEITVKGINGNQKSGLSATVVLKDEVNDLALLKLDDRVLLDSVPYSIKKEAADVGENVFVLGYPLVTTMGSEIKLTNGIISSKSGYEGNINSYQLSAPVQPGNSGGPVFDSKGNLVAIINAHHLGTENVSYAIKAKYLLDLLESSDKKINLTNVGKLSGKSLPEQVKMVSDFIYIIDVK